MIYYDQRERVKYTYVPGLAIKTNVKYSNNYFNDELQKVILKLLKQNELNANSMKFSSEILAEKLGFIEKLEMKILQNALLELSDIGKIKIAEGIISLNKAFENIDEDIAMNVWCFYNCITKEFLDCGLNDEWLELNDEQNEFQSNDNNGQEINTKEIRQKLFNDIRQNKINIYGRQADNNYSIVIDAKSIRSFNVHDLKPIKFPLILPLEMIPTLANKAIIYFYDPIINCKLEQRPYKINLSIRESLLVDNRNILDSINEEAMLVNRKYLEEQRADIFIPLGGKEKVDKEAKNNVNEMLKIASLKKEFYNEDLGSYAFDAELRRILYLAKITPESVYQIDMYVHIFMQIMLRIGQILREVYTDPTIVKHIRTQIRYDESFVGNMIENVEATFGIYFNKIYKMGRFLKDPENRIIKYAKDNKLELSPIVMMWIFILFLDKTIDKRIELYQDWLKRIYSRNPNFITEIEKSIQLRNETQKAGVWNQENFTYEGFRKNVYKIWELIGSTYPDQTI